MDLVYVVAELGESLSSLRVDNRVDNLFSIAENHEFSIYHVVVLGSYEADHVLKVSDSLKSCFLLLASDDKDLERSEVSHLTISKNFRLNLDRNVNFNDILVLQHRLSNDRSEDALPSFKFKLEIYKVNVLSSCSIKLVVTVALLSQFQRAFLMIKA